jgi:hypothetical protein
MGPVGFEVRLRDSFSVCNDCAVSVLDSPLSAMA